MDTIASFLAGMAGGALSTIVAYLYQFRNDNRFAWKNRNRYLYKMLKEARRMGAIELEHSESWIAASRQDYNQFPELKQASYQAISLLAQTVTDAEYYFAYNRLFTNYTEAEEMFLKLQYSIAQLKGLMDQTSEMVQNGYRRYNTRQKAIVDVFVTCDEWTNVAMQNHSAQTIPYLKEYKRLRAAYGDEVGNGSADIHLMMTVVMTPIAEMLGAKRIPDDMLPFAQLVNKFSIMYSEIGFQNQSLVEVVESNKESMKPALTELDIVYSYWTQHFYSHIE